jgi:hypothetical protein
MEALGVFGLDGFVVFHGLTPKEQEKGQHQANGHGGDNVKDCVFHGDTYLVG